MYAQKRMNLYKQQSVQTSPAQLVAKLYDLGIRACREEDRAQLRKVLVELIGSINFEKGGALAEQLYGLYQYCMQESATGDLQTIADLLDDLRTTWRQHVLRNRAA
jgi:flagellar secretion chaperone FliS